VKTTAQQGESRQPADDKPNSRMQDDPSVHRWPNVFQHFLTLVKANESRIMPMDMISALYMVCARCVRESSSNGGERMLPFEAALLGGYHHGCGL
jgi:hypothetical protein